MAMTASAAATAGQITFNGATTGTHTYTAYQIFSGTADGNGFGGKSKLNNPEWACATEDAATFLAALKTDARFNTTTPADEEAGTGESTANDFASCTTAAAVAEVLSGYDSNSTKAKAFADFVVENKEFFIESAVSEEGIIELADGESTTADGYYVIEETSLADGGTKTSYLLGVYDASEGAEITVKSDMPTFEKKIMDTNDSTGETSDWQDSADYDFNDNVPFQLTATLPSNYADYKHYNLVFHDDLQADVFSLNADSIKVYLVNGTEEAELDSTYWTKTVHTTPVTDTQFNSGKTDGDEDFNVEIGDLKLVEGVTKDTKIVVRYDAELTVKANLGTPGNWNSAYLEYANNPNWTGNGEGTPENPEKPGDEDKSKTQEDIVVAFTYQTIINKVDSKGEALTGATFTLEKEIKGEDGAESTWVEIAQVETESGSEFKFEGLDDGNYRLTETNAPQGYKQLENPITFTVVATHTQDIVTEGDKEIKTDAVALELISLTGAVTSDNANSVVNLTEGNLMPSVLADGSLTGDVLNTSGSELPSTGGIGTTLFYLGGGAMVAVAGVFLITKKRMGKSEN
ncbi:MAG: SpaA isopeptide-forming pilin-related protein [Muribaculaceae bacterium]|nr:SpaA isopeptide-forming pilin-related protein [Muribaculaceae bacterium]